MYKSDRDVPTASNRHLAFDTKHASKGAEIDDVIKI